MPTYNGILKKWNGSAWDILQPKTIAENIISGVLHNDRIPVLEVGKIPNLDANKITTGILDAGRLPAIAITNVVVSTTLATYIAGYVVGAMQSGDVLILTTDKKTYIHNGGSAGTSADFTLMETPTDLVTSVAGKTGVVTLVKGDVGLGNVDNTSDAAKPVSTAQQTALNLKYDANNPSGFISSVPNDHVTNARLANMAVNTIKGRVTASTGDPEDLTPAQARTIMGVSSTSEVTDALALKADLTYVDNLGVQMLLADVLPTTGLKNGQMGFEW